MYQAVMITLCGCEKHVLIEGGARIIEQIPGGRRVFVATNDVINGARVYIERGRGRLGKFTREEVKRGR